MDILKKSPSELGVVTVEEAHYATQLAVWIAANELTEEDLVAKNERVHNLMKRLVEVSKKETESQDIFFKVNPVDPQTATQKRELFRNRILCSANKCDFWLLYNSS